MPVLAPIPPRVLKDVFEQNGYRVIDEDEYNWLLEQSDGVAFLIPKKGDLVAVPIMVAAQHSPGIGRSLLEAVQKHASSGAGAETGTDDE